MAKNLKPSGFVDYNPEKQKIFDELKKIIEKNYSKFWFVNIETPSVENNSVLTAKWWDEVAKQVFGLYWLAQWASDAKKYSLHFDLTIPFARYAIEYEEDIKFPFKRYQIQKVFRWERAQKGRYREFYQCDIDIVWETISEFYDVEIIETLYNSLKNILSFLKINKKAIVHLNNKYLIESLIEKFEIENAKEFFKLLDDYYKLEKQDFENKLKELSPNNYSEILKTLKKDLNEIIESLYDLNSNRTIKLQTIYNTLKNRWVNVVFDPYITRWLDYYTWVVFETFIEDYESSGSVCSGGRYDNLVWAIRKATDSKWTELVWVGWSIWLSRLFSLLEENNLLNKKLNLTDIIIFNCWCSNDYREKIIWALKNTYQTFDVYYNKAKLDKQFKYAKNKNIKYWIFAGEAEEERNEIKIKDLENRTEEKFYLKELIKTKSIKVLLKNKNIKTLSSNDKYLYKNL